ncbi:GGDEF domain-containing protein [Vibrio splendidus]|uniref:GGDEF domain-containing protein n=1 Tax=Vibrio splendidus TaxID=29497 RepID=UPI003D0A9217
MFLQKIKNKAYLRSLQGALLALGFPVCWLFVEIIHYYFLNTLFSIEMLLITSLTFGGLIVLSSFGFYLGRKEDTVYKETLIDPLTLVYNVRYFRIRLAELISEHQREGEDKSLYLVMFDIDNFKRVNDQYGHVYGDKTLKNIASTVGEFIRTHDYLARIGGDEFAILFSKSNASDVEGICGRILHAVESLNIEMNNSYLINMSISLGVTDYRKHDSAKTFCARADKVMYQAKLSGKNRIMVDISL